MPTSPLLSTGTGRFVGRTTELNEFAMLFNEGSVRILTLLGPGGVGKSRLALATADANVPKPFRRATIVPLSSVTDASRVGLAIAIAFQLVVDDPRALAEKLDEQIGSDRHLLILDNFEHVTDAAPLITSLVQEIPTLSVLVTSRTPLRLTDEHLIEVRPFDVTDLENTAPTSTHPAVALFLDRAARLGVPIDATELPFVGRICRDLAGLPLAIELAAGRTRELPLPAIAAAMDDPLPVLGQGPRDLPDRLRTLENSVSWSYHLLPLEVQPFFDRLCLFVGGFAPEAAAAMAAGREAGQGYPWSGGYGVPHPDQIHWLHDPTTEQLEDSWRHLDRELPLTRLEIDPLESLAALVDQSLLRLHHGRDGSPRYEILEPIRAYGLRRLSDSGSEASVRHAHAAWVCSFAEASNAGLWTKHLRLWEIGRIEDEMPNIRSALDWLLSRGRDGVEVALRTASTLSFYWQVRGLTGEALDWLEQIFAVAPGPDWIRAEALTAFGTYTWIRGGTDRAEIALLKAREIGERIGNRRIVATAHFYSALVAWRHGDLLKMRVHIQSAFPLFAEWEDLIGMGVCRLAEGVGARILHETVIAGERFREAAGYHDAAGFEWGVATAHYYLGELARDDRRWTDCASELRTALQIYWKMSDGWGTGGAIGGLAALAAERGQWDEAARLFGASARLAGRSGALLPPTELSNYRRIAEVGRSDRGPLFTLLQESGAALEPNAAVEEALGFAAGVLGERSDHGWLAEANERTRALVALSRLTDRQRDVLRELLQDREIKEIGFALHLKYNTVHGHVQTILKTFGADSTQGLVRMLDRTGVAEVV